MSESYFTYLDDRLYCIGPGCSDFIDTTGIPDHIARAIHIRDRHGDSAAKVRGT